MSETLKIRSANGARVLEIAPQETDDPARRFDYFDVRLDGEGLRASTRIYNYRHAGSACDLAHFFQDLAANWRGWEGEKRWESLEGDLRINCTSETLGRINLSVELRADQYDSFNWDVRCSLVLEPGQLDALAAEAKKVFPL